jgi:hypothetical protein
MRSLLDYLESRPDTATFLLPNELGRTLDEMFPRATTALPQPYKIFPADEGQRPTLGFPVAETSAMKDLDSKLDNWLTHECAWNVKRDAQTKEKAQIAFSLYTGQLMKLAENAMMANVLSDYHAVFWLAHSFDLARQFGSIPRRINTLDAQLGKTQGDQLKYRIYQRWVTETRELMTQVATKAAALLDGDEQRALQFVRLLQEDVLLLTEEFIGPDLRELRSFLTGYLRRDFQSFRDSYERLRTTATDLLQKDRTFRASLPLFGSSPDQGITIALLLDARFQGFLYEHSAIQNAVTREDREQFALIARRIREFAVLNQLRRAIVWMVTLPTGQIVADRRTATNYSRSTRPMDFGRPGVVDPMVHRFGLIYDISAFSETLGAIRRGGGKEEVRSYRQMLLFQRRLETIATRHLLVFEKFLGDGAFYTTRRALRLIRAAVEIQRFYAEMKRKGFAFNKGLRIALNYGYYRLLPMKSGGPDSNERITEFYGPGIVELSRLTTGKANKEIEEIAAFLIARGYDSSKVQAFFAPLARGVDVIDHAQQTREFYAYLNANGNLINEGIITSFELLSELSNELTQEGQQLYRIKSQFGTYIGFAPAVPGLEHVGIRLLGMVSLKGLDNIEVGEIVPFAPGEAEAKLIDGSDSLVAVLRQEYHRDDEPMIPAPSFDDENDETSEQPRGRLHDTTTERPIESELVICVPSEDDGDEVLIGEWDPRSDDLNRPLRLPRSDLKHLLSVKGVLTLSVIADKKQSVRDLYARLAAPAPALPLADYREGVYDAFVLGEIVEKL